MNRSLNITKMMRGLPRRIISIVTLASFVSLFNYCAVFAALTGHVHHPKNVADLVQKTEGHCCHHAAKPQPAPTKSRPDPCCDPSVQHLSALTPTSSAQLKVIMNHGSFLVLEADAAVLFVRTSEPRSQSPPGSAADSFLRFTTSFRGPPHA